MGRLKLRRRKRAAWVALIVAVASTFWAGSTSAQNVSGYAMIPEPLLFLLREPAVQKDLQLSESQLRQLNELNHSLDGQLLASRNRPPQEAQKMSNDALQKTRDALKTVLSDSQRQRLQQIQYRLRGISFVLIPEAAAALELTEAQRSEFQEFVKTAQERIAAATSKTYQGPEAHAKSQEEVIAARRAEQNGIANGLTNSQRRILAQLVGEPFDATQLGQVSFKAPELSDGDTWINSKSLKLQRLEGKVVAVHFWAFGCINCIHNYPWYKEWQQKFKNEDFVMIGVHTPETNVERDVDRLREKVKEAGFQFPIVVDNEKSNWKSWGNSMWPAVYLVDKQGRIRFWWYGELDWNGAGGQKIMGDRIRQLLNEEA